MANIESALFEIGALETLARRDSPIHRRDARVKILATMLFILTVVSFHRYTLAGLAPLAVFPVALAVLGGVPARAIATRLLLAAPFVLLVGMFNPLLERQALLHWGPLAISAGWVSFASIVARFALSLSAALILISTTGLDGVCAGLARLGAPRLFTVQLLLLFRYLFVLTEEATRMLRAWALRSPGKRAPTPRLTATLLGQLLLRAMDRAHRIHMAMLSRGFSGELHPARAMRMRAADWGFLLLWAAYFLAVRTVDVTQVLGRLATGG